MNLLTKIFGMDKVVEKGEDLIDAAFFTDQEKATMAQKRLDVQLEVQRIIATEGLPTAISRRILAFMIMGMFLFLILLGVVIYPFNTTWAKVVFENGVNRLELLAAAVGATYFIKDAVVKAIQAKKE